MGQINIIFQTFFSLISIFFKSLETALYNIVQLITCDANVTIAIFLQLFIFYIVIKKVGIMPALLSLCYSYFLFEFIYNNDTNTYGGYLAL
jgi:hypothetical protein